MWKINLGSKIDQRIEKYLDTIWRDGSARSGRKGAFLDRWTCQERQRHLLRSMRLRSAFRVVFLFYKGRFGSGWRRRGRGKEMQGIEGQLKRVGGCHCDQLTWRMSNEDDEPLPKCPHSPAASWTASRTTTSAPVRRASSRTVASMTYSPPSIGQ